MAEEKKETKKGNKVLVVFFILFLILSIGMGTFIFINKDKLFSKNTTSVEKNETKDSTKKDTNKETSTTSDECDKVSYDLNTNEYGLSVNNAGLFVYINPTEDEEYIFDFKCQLLFFMIPAFGFIIFISRMQYAFFLGLNIIYNYLI